MARTPKLITIVQRLFQHTGTQMPDFQSDDDAANQLEILLRQRNCPILLVLDDVWPESVSLVDKFVFQIPNYMILMTSRVKIREFDPAYVLKPLDEVNAMNLFCHSASLNQSRSHISDDVVQKIVKGCSGFPLALTVIGRNLKHQELIGWDNMAEKLSTGHSILDSNDYVLNCLQKSFDVLDAKVAECFRDLGLFPEAQRIPAAALVDMWAELHDETDSSAMGKIHELFYRNMADIVVTRNITSGTGDYNYHYVTQHGLLRDLAILQTSQGPQENRNRLIIDISGNNLPKWWSTQNEYHIAARILSISTVELFDIVSLKKVSITNCHKLSALPEGIEKLVNLESLRLTSCTSLEELPDSITSLHELKFLDISDCVSLSKLPENLEGLRSLERLNCRGCTIFTRLPHKITDLGGLRVLECDEETAASLEHLRTMLSRLTLKVAQVEFNLNWLSS
ncbi:disease resistance protein [Spatholobus suberectus]|nr:disease resistance protein [Spatholobus suberectus]